ncbi:hypothetical protein VE02_03399 [Pseudogymnoascus sp. 03VT05]|nr:hypothetical protein VE02_03399 [Pseudogymnoascus sp. 03VT05]
MSSQASTDTMDDTCCHICERMNFRDPAWKQYVPSSHCVLCDRPFCYVHQEQTEADGDVCKANHGTYYKVHHHMLPGKVFTSKQERQEELGEEVIARQQRQRKKSIGWTPQDNEDDSRRVSL